MDYVTESFPVWFPGTLTALLAGFDPCQEAFFQAAILDRVDQGDRVVEKPACDQGFWALIVGHERTRRMAQKGHHFHARMGCRTGFVTVAARTPKDSAGRDRS